MSRRVLTLLIPQNRAGNSTCEAFHKGLTRCGVKSILRSLQRGLPASSDYDVLALWGYTAECRAAIRQASDAGKPWIFFDLGYWRRDRGFVKVSVNNRHPTLYFTQRPKPPGRWNNLKVDLHSPRTADERAPIIVAGMSAKAAGSWDLEPEAWEKATIKRLKEVTKRPIIYRPKPSWGGARPIDGVGYDVRTPIEKLLKRCHCVVTHHSNVACDAIVHGVPVFTQHGIATRLANSMTMLFDIEDLSLPTPERRAQWCYDAAYCQWAKSELESGACWDFLLNEGLV